MEKTIIDVNFAIEKHNKKNPKNKLDRTELAEKLGLSYQSLTNYQGGKIPDIVNNIKEIINLTGVDFNDLVKTKK